MSNKGAKIATFEGIRNFRFRLVLATLAGTPIKIAKIRSTELNPGLKDHEVSFLRLLEATTNGSQIEISYTGTTVIFRPGIITGGELTHNCPHGKPISYFLEPMLMLAPFSKKKFSIIFKGLTSLGSNDIEIDSLKWGMIPLMEKFGIREVSIHILKKGAPPVGGGEVHLRCNSLIPQPLTIHALEEPKFSAIRGVAHCARVSPSVVNRIIEQVCEVLRPTGVQVNISADVWRGDNSGKSPGFGLILVAESKQGWRIFTDGVGTPGSLPEDLAKEVSYKLLEELSQSSVVGRRQLMMATCFMAIGKEDVGRMKIHKNQVDENLIWLLRDIKTVLGTEAFLKEDDSDDGFILSIKGVGFTNASKKIA
ncbi:rRNA-processing endoribonuclease [Yamadazyma tenuis]|uniref:18S rRNA biogenesis protein n=1 Tax=Candida tenuis (strain ATCC 10573 / BCRC 21748 / CBS 615 / JCM 9827 / NBRC 10315 / NRRL Y-1498 / VKM Y-70) TaxID=590646 RepID=G3B180_CANTC|nr:18S rRNA biogenesis protein [Yamadazyma tenuis ATCC 10573]EGV64900.1 18S rRNA biogenesis protein [Yamadazyma tenuis ATCC 10573]WEJ97697.1 rRNA-processing endoribonuclease [Yamadazyma tenuis]